MSAGSRCIGLEGYRAEKSSLCVLLRTPSVKHQACVIQCALRQGLLNYIKLKRLQLLNTVHHSMEAEAVTETAYCPKSLLRNTIVCCTVLYYVVLYCTVLYYTILYCNILYCTVLCYTVLQYTILYYTILYSTILYCIILYCTVLYYTVLQYTVLKAYIL